MNTITVLTLGFNRILVFLDFFINLCEVNTKILESGIPSFISNSGPGKLFIESI